MYSAPTSWSDPIMVVKPDLHQMGRQIVYTQSIRYVHMYKDESVQSE